MTNRANYNIYFFFLLNDKSRILIYLFIKFVVEIEVFLAKFTNNYKIIVN